MPVAVALIAAAPAAADDSGFGIAPETIDRLQRSCVRVISFSGDRSSGVVVSRRGHILTVAHGLKSENDAVRVITSSGRSEKADVLLRDPKNDVALLRVRNGRSFHQDDVFSVLLADTQLRTSESITQIAVLSIGYPAREQTGLSPAIRIGTVSAATSQHLRSSCALTAGDSGGPVFDVQGQLLGIHQKIGLGRQFNLHIPLAVCIRTLAPALKQQRLALPPTALQAESPATINLAPSKQVTDQLKKLSVEVSDSHETGVLCHGTQLAKGIIVTKLSELDGRTSVRVSSADGTQSTGEVIGTDRSIDLALLRLNGHPIPEWPDRNPEDRLQNVRPGALIFGRPGVSAGIITRVNHHERAARAALGCTLRTVGRQVIVESVDPESTAKEAGLAPNDAVIEINAIPIHTLDDVAEVLAPLQPGDRVRISTRRGQKPVECSARLHHSPAQLLDRAEFLDGRAGILSLRRTGFRHVIQHDVSVGSEQMGGPLLDGHGQLIGVNIARRSRESVLALSWSTAVAFARECLNTEE